MKNLILSVLALSLATPAFAENFTCLRDHEEAGAQKMDAALKLGVSSALKKLGIHLKEGTLETESSFSYHSEEERTDKWVTHAMLAWNGRATTASGTDLLLFLKRADDTEGGNYAFFLPVLKSKGFDREGNPIDPHCTLHLSSPFVSNVASSVGIRNARSGKVIAAVSLPGTFLVY